ncbi:MAG TPA: SLBB domain-containing protein, partial [Pseudomonadales bacterium]|nr:SLBB domain-containing protein [Pseudomonadales bacterium]
ITTRLKDGYLVNPSVSVAVISYRQFFINGEVKQAGGYAYQPGLTLRKAIALAGGVTERASSSKITVIHENDGERKPKPISLDDVLRPGDIITVYQSFF